MSTPELIGAQGTSGANRSVWELPAEVTGTLVPDKGTSLVVSDGEVLATLTVPRNSVNTATRLTVRLQKTSAGRHVVFEPQLNLSQNANVIIVARGTAPVSIPIAQRASRYHAVRFQVQGSTTSVWVRSADALWVGNTASAQQIAASIPPPADIDCATVSRLGDIDDVKGFAELQSLLGNDRAAAGTYAAMARYAAAELNRILNEAVPSNPCGYYFASLLELGQIIGTTGLVDATVDIGKYRARVEELLARCPLNYELFLEGSEYYPDTAMTFQSREPMRGRLGTTHETPFLLDAIVTQEPMSLNIDSVVRMQSEFELSSAPKIYTKFSPLAIQGTATLRDDEGGGQLEFAISLDAMSPSIFIAGPDKSTPLFAFQGTIAAGQAHVVIAVPDLLIEAHGPATYVEEESFLFELRNRSTIVVHKTTDGGVSTFTGLLYVPALEDIDQLTKMLCELAVSQH